MLSTKIFLSHGVIEIAGETARFFLEVLASSEWWML